jgi:hypothetical protein
MSDGRCESLKRDGTRCGAPALAGSARCYFHDPAKAEERQQARRRGAKTRNRKPPPPTHDLTLGTVTDVAKALAKVINEVRRGTLEPKVGNSIAALVSQLLAALKGGELEQRLAALEQRLAQQRDYP